MYVFIAVLCIFCVVVIMFNLMMMLFSYSYMNWNVVEGEIIERDLKRNTYPTKQPASEGPIVRSAYLLKVKYMYEVNGKKYFNKRLNFDLIDKEYVDETSANNELDKIIFCNRVNVYYNRFLPFISAIMPSKTGVIANIIIIVLCIVVIIGMLFVIV